VSDMLVPDWIKEKEAENKLTEAEREAEEQRQRAATLVIERDGPEFWEQLVREFSFNTNSLPRIGLQGSVDLLPCFTPPERSCRVSVVSPKSFARQASTDLSYIAGQREIRCSIVNGGVFTFQLCVVEGEQVRAFRGGQTTALTAKEMAEQIVKRMVATVG
jgi:hypothetical protein